MKQSILRFLLSILPHQVQRYKVEYSIAGTGKMTACNVKGRFVAGMNFFFRPQSNLIFANILVERIWDLVTSVVVGFANSNKSVPIIALTEGVVGMEISITISDPLDKRDIGDLTARIKQLLAERVESEREKYTLR